MATVWLWEKHRKSMLSDIPKRVRREFPDLDTHITLEMLIKALISIEDEFLKITGKSMVNFSMTSLTRTDVNTFHKRDFFTET